MSDHPADIVAVGFQEVVPLNANSVVMGKIPVLEIERKARKINRKIYAIGH